MHFIESCLWISYHISIFDTENFRLGNNLEPEFLVKAYIFFQICF